MVKINRKIKIIDVDDNYDDLKLQIQDEAIEPIQEEILEKKPVLKRQASVKKLNQYKSQYNQLKTLKKLKNQLKKLKNQLKNQLKKLNQLKNQLAAIRQALPGKTSGFKN
jgi:predicted RNase H-like nuclease (RuvC/YqgF family)